MNSGLSFTEKIDELNETIALTNNNNLGPDLLNYLLPNPEHRVDLLV